MHAGGPWRRADGAPSGRHVPNRSPRRFSGPTQVTYELQAVQGGTAELSIGITFETRSGCPGNDVYVFTGTGSETFPLTISAAACAGVCNARTERRRCMANLGAFAAASFTRRGRSLSAQWESGSAAA